MYVYSCMAVAFLMCVCVCVCESERVSPRRGCLVNVVGNSIFDNMQLKALCYNNCQAWQHLTGLWARMEGQMGCGALQLCVCVCVHMVVAHSINASPCVST